MRGPAGRGRAPLSASSNSAAQGPLRAGVRGLDDARPVGLEVDLLVGRWPVREGGHRRSQECPAHDRRRAHHRGQSRAGLREWRAREQGELAQAPTRSQAPWAYIPATHRGRMGTGIWAACGEIHPTGQEQRCWNHKITNVLDALPKKEPQKAAEWLKAMPYAETQGECERLRDAFVRTYHKTDKKAVETLLRDWDRMVTFYSFPREHWGHIRTTNIVESPFSSVRLRTDASRRYKRVEGATAIIWKMLRVAEQAWRKLNASELLPLVASGMTFKDGIALKSGHKEPHGPSAREDRRLKFIYTLLDGGSSRPPFALCDDCIPGHKVMTASRQVGSTHSHGFSAPTLAIWIHCASMYLYGYMIRVSGLLGTFCRTACDHHNIAGISLDFFARITR